MRPRSTSTAILAGLASLAFLLTASPAAADFGFVTKWGGDREFSHDGPSGVATDRAGNVWVTDEGLREGMIRKYTSAGVLQAGWGEYGEGTDNPFHISQQRRFNEPLGIDTDGAGNLYIADAGNDLVKKMTPDGEGLIVYGRPWDPDRGFDRFDRFESPLDVAVGNRNAYLANEYQVYVIDHGDYGNGRVLAHHSGGGLVSKMWGADGVEVRDDGNARRDFFSPGGIATDAAGNVYVADQAYDRIQKFTPNGGLITEWGSEGSGDGQFDDPTGVATDPAGNVYVADTDNFRVQKFTSAGAFLAKWGRYGPGDGEFSWARDVDVDAAGNVYVASAVDPIRDELGDVDDVYFEPWIQKFGEVPAGGFPPPGASRCERLKSKLIVYRKKVKKAKRRGARVKRVKKLRQKVRKVRKAKRTAC